jgi:ribosomal protein S18 acetylase RimI-like enzyme
VTGPAPIELARFYVGGPWQGQGVAQRLMAEVGSVIRGMGGQTVWLGVWELNPRAIAFYAKCGFQDAGNADFYVGPERQSDRIMVAPVESLAKQVP